MTVINCATCLCSQQIDSNIIVQREFNEEEEEEEEDAIKKVHA